MPEVPETLTITEYHPGTDEDTIHSYVVLERHHRTLRPAKVTLKEAISGYGLVNPSIPGSLVETAELKKIDGISAIGNIMTRIKNGQIAKPPSGRM